MGKVVHSLLILAILAVVFSTAHKAWSAQNPTVNILNLLDPIKEHIKPNSKIFFQPTDSTLLYYQSQLALAPAVLSNTEVRDTTLHITNELYIPTGNERIIVQYNSNAYFVCLKTLIE